MLYASIGDRGPMTEPLAQDLSNHDGKIVRLYDDGRVPADNPFIGRPGAKPEIYSYGHRNPQGMTINPETGEVWASEHGPMGGDEVNIIKRGANYGWPVVSYGRKYTGEIISEQPFREGMASSSGRARPTPAPLRRVRRERCFFVKNIIFFVPLVLLVVPSCFPHN